MKAIRQTNAHGIKFYRLEHLAIVMKSPRASRERGRTLGIDIRQGYDLRPGRACEDSQMKLADVAKTNYTYAQGCVHSSSPRS